MWQLHHMRFHAYLVRHDCNLFFYLFLKKKFKQKNSTRWCSHLLSLQQCHNCHQNIFEVMFSFSYTEMRVCCSLPWLPALSDLYSSPQALGNLISVENLLTKQTIARRQEWANKDISVNNINNYNIDSVTRLIYFITLYFQQH